MGGVCSMQGGDAYEISVGKSVTFTEPSGITYTHPYAPRHDFNAMDCTDIVIGSARGTASRIWDYYTRDRY
jgi:hypothetical protein